MIGYAVVFTSIFVNLPPVRTMVGSALFVIGAAALLIGVVWLNVESPWEMWRLLTLETAPIALS